MAKLFLAEKGEVRNIKPKNGKNFKLKELQEYVYGYIEIRPSLAGDQVMVMNEDGLTLRLPYNKLATLYYEKYFNPVSIGSQIRGDVVVCEAHEIQ